MLEISSLGPGPGFRNRDLSASKPSLSDDFGIDCKLIPKSKLVFRDFGSGLKPIPKPNCFSLWNLASADSMVETVLGALERALADSNVEQSFGTLESA